MPASGNNTRKRTPNNIGEARRRHALRTAGGSFTQADAARALGVSRTSVAAWEQGVGRGLYGDQLTRIADLYGVTVDYLLRRASDPDGDAAAGPPPPGACGAELAGLVECYRRLTDEGRKTLAKLASAMAASPEYAATPEDDSDA